jgi:methionine--tRNA ligase beta chain
MSDLRTKVVKPSINISDLEKIDIRVGTIIKIEDIENSDKLVKLNVNFGDFQRKIIVGLKKERDNPQEIEGMQALFIVNLKTRKIMGEDSEGMLFDIGYNDGIAPVLAISEKTVPDGVQAG